MKPKYTLKSAQEILKPLKLTIVKDDYGDYIVYPTGTSRHHATAYFTPWIDDAVHTALQNWKPKSEQFVKNPKKHKKIKKLRKNPSKKLTSYIDNNRKYIKLDSFQSQFSREMDNLIDDKYYEYYYEIDNILKYGFKTNDVSVGIKNIKPLYKFKKIMFEGLNKRFSLSGIEEFIMEAFEKTWNKIPEDVEFIDIGN